MHGATRNSARITLLLATLLDCLTACGTVKVGIAHLSTPDPRAESTAIAQATEHARLATEVAALEATLGITPEPTPLTGTVPAPIPGDEPGVFYQPIPLDFVANAPTGFASPPSGQRTLGDIPFELSANIFKSQSASSPGDAYSAHVLFPMDVPQASRAHLLLNTGNGFAQFDGQVIGQVVAHCDDVPILVTDLQLGRDVREWHLAYNVVYTVERARQVWVGTLAGYPGVDGHIDLLSLDLPPACQEGTLTAIEIADTSADTVGSRDPALNLFGVTIEYRR
jgi:hypothetical protein